MYKEFLYINKKDNLPFRKRKVDMNSYFSKDPIPHE